MANYASAVIAEARTWNSYQEKKQLGTRSQMELKHWNPGSANLTIFWIWFKDWGLTAYQGQPWCAAFVSCCFRNAYGDANARRLLGGSYYINCADFVTRHANDKRLNSTPKVGAVVFFWNGKKWSHTGIVTGVYRTYITSIEGNTSGTYDKVVSDGGAVVEKSHYFSTTTMKYWHPDYDSEEAPEVEISEPYAICTGKDGLILTAALNVREKPYNGKVVETLPKGYTVYPNQKVFVKTKSGSNPWYYVPDKGYISAKYVEGWVYENAVKRWWFVYKDYSCLYSTLFVVDDETYYSDETGYIVQSQWVEFADGWRYFDGNGCMVRSTYVQAASGKLWYWINEYGLWDTSKDTTDPSKGVPERLSVASNMRLDILDLVNTERYEAGVKMLGFRDDLTAAADLRAYESSVKWSHDRPNNTMFYTADDKIYGENLAKGYKTAADVVNAWMKSETHRKVMLDPQYKGASVGLYSNGSNNWYSLELTL